MAVIRLPSAFVSYYYRSFSDHVSLRHDVAVSTGPLFKPVTADNQCVLPIDMNASGYEITSWSNIWAAAVAVQEMCVKQGKIGASKINGLSKFTDSLAILYTEISMVLAPHR